MKKPKLGNYLLWKGELAKVIGRSDSQTFHIEMIEDSKCPHCDKSIGKHQFAVIPESPLFQENAEPVETIKYK